MYTNVIRRPTKLLLIPNSVGQTSSRGAIGASVGGLIGEYYTPS
jgi:hypothetical protein